MSLSNDDFRLAVELLLDCMRNDISPHDPLYVQAVQDIRRYHADNSIYFHVVSLITHLDISEDTSCICCLHN